MTHRAAAAATQTAGDVMLEELLAAPVAGDDSPSAQRITAVKIGRIVGLADHGETALVTYQEQPTSAALKARATFHLDAPHIGSAVVLAFEDGDPLRPLVLGCLGMSGSAALRQAGGHVDVTADDERIVVSAKEQIVLRCGKASITLTKDGKVIVKGAYVSHQSTGVLRIKGGSVQIN